MSTTQSPEENSTPVSRLIGQFIRLKLLSEGRASRLTEEHKKLVKALDRKYWADKADLEQEYRQALHNEDIRYQQALLRQKNSHEAELGRVYREAQQEEERTNPDQEPQVVEEEQEQTSTSPQGVEAEAVAPPIVKVLGIGSRVRIKTGIYLSGHKGKIYGAKGDVTRFTNDFVVVAVRNHQNNKIEEFCRKEHNLTIL